MKIYQSRSFEQKVKKMSKQEKDVLDLEIQKIAENHRSERKRRAI
jgi:hypothetical protein